MRLRTFPRERNPDMANRKWGEGPADGWLPYPRGRNGRPGSVFRGATEGFRRARVQHEHDRLHGSAHRSLVPRPDFDDDLSADRQLRSLPRHDADRDDPADRTRRPRGVKRNIIREAQRYADVIRVPYDATSDEILAHKPDGVILSNGPGDPAHPEIRATAVKAAKDLVGRTPLLGICLGHQLLALAFGGKTYKLKFGHRGGNQPVKDLRSGRVHITSQNHGFAVDADSLPSSEFEVTHLNLNDGTVEGMAHRELPIFSVQYHPEARPGPWDNEYIFRDFVAELKGA